MHLYDGLIMMSKMVQYFYINCVKDCLEFYIWQVSNYFIIQFYKKETMETKLYLIVNVDD